MELFSTSSFLYFIDYISVKLSTEYYNLSFIDLVNVHVVDHFKNKSK